MGRITETADRPYDRIVARMREKWPNRYPKSKKTVPQRDVAKLAGVSQPAVAKWKEGGPIDHSNVVRLAIVLDLAIEWIESGRGAKFPGPANDPLLDELWSLITRLDELQRMEVARYAGYLHEDSARKLG